MLFGLIFIKAMLYLPTQDWRRMCHVSWIKMHLLLREQKLELSTCAQVAHLEPHRSSVKTSLFPLGPVIKYSMSSMFISGLKNDLVNQTPIYGNSKNPRHAIDNKQLYIFNKAPSTVRDTITLRLILIFGIK